MDEDRRPEDEPVEERGEPVGERGEPLEERGEPIEQDAPLGGDEPTEDQLVADNPAEEETLKTLDPGAPPA